MYGVPTWWGEEEEPHSPSDPTPRNRSLRVSERKPENESYRSGSEVFTSNDEKEKEEEEKGSITPSTSFTVEFESPKRAMPASLQRRTLSSSNKRPLSFAGNIEKLKEEMTSPRHSLTPPTPQYKKKRSSSLSKAPGPSNKREEEEEEEEGEGKSRRIIRSATVRIKSSDAIRRRSPSNTPGNTPSNTPSNTPGNTPGNSPSKGPSNKREEEEEGEGKSRRIIRSATVCVKSSSDSSRLNRGRSPSNDPSNSPSNSPSKKANDEEEKRGSTSKRSLMMRSGTVKGREANEQVFRGRTSSMRNKERKSSPLESSTSSNTSLSRTSTITIRKKSKENSEKITPTKK